ncbi:DUF3782 domain-containing protein [Methylomagnum ishizawai]|uniref:DUF3782 domain-containing protein n=1 Tax=Methylomagnum ishizawai TaxID=1760988 RepID=UPI001C38EBFD|nr:DUF3782 domain-containing protein [Methylomagnum ishizawai]
MVNTALKETDCRLKKLGKQISSLGEKFGSFIEGLVLPSMQKILNERFGMQIVSPSVRAYTNSDQNVAYTSKSKAICAPRPSPR